MVINRFKTDPDYRLDTMTHQFLPCLMQLKLSSEEDQAYISEIQRIWCLLLDKLERREVFGREKNVICLFSNGTFVVPGRISSTFTRTTDWSTLSFSVDQ